MGGPPLPVSGAHPCPHWWDIQALGSCSCNLLLPTIVFAPNMLESSQAGWGGGQGRVIVQPQIYSSSIQYIHLDRPKWPIRSSNSISSANMVYCDHSHLVYPVFQSPTDHNKDAWWGQESSKTEVHSLRYTSLSISTPINSWLPYLEGTPLPTSCLFTPMMSLPSNVVQMTTSFKSLLHPPWQQVHLTYIYMYPYSVYNGYGIAASVFCSYVWPCFFILLFYSSFTCFVWYMSHYLVVSC